MNIQDFISLVTTKYINDIYLNAKITVDDIVLCPLYNNLDENQDFISKIKDEMSKSKSLFMKLFGSEDIHRNIKKDNIQNSKIFLLTQNYEISLSLNISRVILDVFSQYIKNIEKSKHAELKDK
jgi:hypothetical protein